MIKLFLLLSIISVQGSGSVFYKGSLYKTLDECKSSIVIHENLLAWQAEQRNYETIWIESHCLEFEGFPPLLPS